jgi:hypothetical protein
MQLFVGIGIDLHSVRRKVLTGFPLAIGRLSGFMILHYSEMRMAAWHR